MRAMKPCWVVGLTLLSLGSSRAEPASVASIEPAQLVEYAEQPEPVRELIDYALSLTREELAYRFGSNDPDKDGMDCSGTVQHTLRAVGVERVPRSSHTIYRWAKRAGNLTPTGGVTSTKDPIFADLRPGDLLFWEGTYDAGDRDPPISHVMIYLGRLREDGRGVVFGASSGRRFRGKRIHGVSVFDWEVPSAESSAGFVAFGPPPGLRTSDGTAATGPSGAPAVEVAEREEKKNAVKSFLEKLFEKRQP